MVVKYKSSLQTMPVLGSDHCFANQVEYVACNLLILLIELASSRPRSSSVPSSAFIVGRD